jgi:hypothetical protein
VNFEPLVGGRQIILILFRHTPGQHGQSAHFPDRAVRMCENIRGVVNGYVRVPTSREASEWFVPNALMFARAQTKLDFDIAHRVPVTCGSLLQKGLERISNSLRG